MQNATSGFEKVLGDSLRANPDSFVKNLMEAKTKLLTGHYAYPHVQIKPILIKFSAQILFCNNG